MGVYAAGAAILALVFLGVYLLVRRGRKQTFKVGKLETNDEIHKRSRERSRRAQALRARPRRTPQQLLDALRRHAGDRPPSDPPVS